MNDRTGRARGKEDLVMQHCVRRAGSAGQNFLLK